MSTYTIDCSKQEDFQFFIVKVRDAPAVVHEGNAVVFEGKCIHIYDRETTLKEFYTAGSYGSLYKDTREIHTDKWLATYADYVSIEPVYAKGEADG